MAVALRSVAAEIEKKHSLIYPCTTVKKRNFGSQPVCNRWKPNLSMNSKRIFCVICCSALLMTAPFALGGSRGGGGGGRGGGSFSGMGAARSGSSFDRSGMGAWNGGNRNWSGQNRSGQNWSGRNSSANGHHHDGHHHDGHHHNHPNRVANRVVFIGDFGFPWWWGWGWGWSWGWGYPYGYYGYYPYDYYGYGYGYGGDRSDYGQYGDRSASRVAELQRRLARAGYYHGAIDGILGPQTRAAIRAYERDHGDVS
jgi:hypothetical protein